MVNINKCHFAGNLTRDPEVKFLADQTCVARFTLAINRTFKNKAGDKVEEVSFLDFDAWGRTAELIGQHCSKGVPLYVECRAKLERWEKDGQKRQAVRFVVDAIQFLGAPKARSESGPNAPAEPTPPAATQTAPAGAAVGTAGDDEPPF